MALCQAPVPKPVDLVDDGSGWERLRTCPSCNYSFCAFCKRTWYVCDTLVIQCISRLTLAVERHGPLTDCPIPLSEKVVAEYMANPAGSTVRKNLDLRYGAKNLVKLVARWQEEKANRDYFEENSTSCPHCSVRVQKSHGCNHVRYDLRSLRTIGRSVREQHADPFISDDMRKVQDSLLLPVRICELQCRNG